MDGYLFVLIKNSLCYKVRYVVRAVCGRCIETVSVGGSCTGLSLYVACRVGFLSPGMSLRHSLTTYNKTSHLHCYSRTSKACSTVALLQSNGVYRISLIVTVGLNHFTILFNYLYKKFLNFRLLPYNKKLTGKKVYEYGLHSF